MSLVHKFRESAKSLRSPSSLCTVALLTAMYVALQFVAIQPNEMLKISFSFLPLALVGALFGPVPAMLAGGVGDLLQYLVKPTGAFFPGFTLSAILDGLIFGLILYRQRPAVWRLTLSRIAMILVVNIGLNSIWLHLLYGSSLFVWMRVVKNVIQLPIDIVMMVVLFRVVEKALPAKLQALLSGEDKT